MRIRTKVIHSGQPNDSQTGAVSFPIYQTSTYEQHSPGVPKGFTYGRTDNPTRTALENCLAEVESGKYGLVFSSGLGAVNTVMNMLKSGDHVVACDDIYGGTYRIFTKVYQKFGLQFTFVDGTNSANFERALKTNTRVIWLETPSNPLLKVTDIEDSIKRARKHAPGIMAVVDNTFATPMLQRPLELGADVVLHSTTKYINGHADVIGGALITNNKDYYEQQKYYQNAVGAVPGPQDCYLILRGMKTLPLRMKQHCENAEAVAKFLLADKNVKKVFYPGLEQHTNHTVAKKQMDGFGGIVSFELNGDIETAKTFIKNLKVVTLAESLGAVKSLICVPALMTHASVEPEERRKRGIEDSLIRFSVGIEDAEDIIDDLKGAFDATFGKKDETRSRKLEKTKQIRK